MTKNGPNGTKVVKAPDYRKYLSPFGPKPKAGKVITSIRAGK